MIAEPSSLAQVHRQVACELAMIACDARRLHSPYHGRLHPPDIGGLPMNARTLSPLDRLLAGIERALETVAGAPEANRPSPARGTAHAELDDAERRHAAGLMRVNHTGEVCAQALYDG